MGILKRLFGIGKAEANAALDKLEDPVKMTEQGIKDLKDALEKTNNSTREVKSKVVQMKTKSTEFGKQADEWKEKAKKLVEKNQEELAITALNKHENLKKEAATYAAQAERLQKTVSTLVDKANEIKDAISKSQRSLSELKARDTAADALNEANKQMNSDNVDSIMATLNRMNEKVEDKEALNEADAILAEEGKSDEDRIAELLEKDSETDNSSLLASLKEEMNNEKKEA